MEERFKTFTFLIGRITKNIRKIKAEEMSEFELKSPHVSCLYYLYKQPNMSASKLSEVCDEDKSAISRSLEQLEGSGYLTCNSKTKKKYNCPLELTEKGVRVAEIVVDKIDAIVEVASKGLSAEKRAIFYESLTLINDNIQKFCDKYGV